MTANSELGTHRTIPVDLPGLLVISALPALLLSLVRLVLDQPGDGILLQSIPTTDVMALGVHLGSTDVV